MTLDPLMKTDKYKQYRKDYYIKNKEKMCAMGRQYYAANAEKCKQASKDKYAEIKLKEEIDIKEFKSKSSSYHREYYLKHRTEIIARQRAYNAKHKKINTFSSKTKNKKSNVAIKQAYIESQLAELLVKKEAFKKKLAGANEVAVVVANNITIP
jgi:hypothetical protein